MCIPVQHPGFRASALALLTIALLTIALIAVVCGGAVSADIPSSTTTLSNDNSVSILPVRFIPNYGQFEDQVSFAVLRGQTSLTFMPDSLVVHGYGTGQKDSGDSAAIVQTWEGADPNPLIEGTGPQENTASFFFGSESSCCYTNLTTYTGIVYRGLYPGIDCVYRDAGGRIKREFVVAPGANPSKIRVHYEGITGISVDTDGTLVITTNTGIQTESVPVGFQMIDGREVTVPVCYQLLGGNDVGFEIGAYDPAVPLTIDPQLLYSTYLGGLDNEDGNCITLDPAGNIYVTGTTSSPDFPITKDAQSPDFSESATGSSQMFVTKLDATTHRLVYSTYLGGSAGGYNPRIAVDSSGSAFLTGKTSSADFPTTPGAYSRTGSGVQDIFVTKIDPSGSSLVYSTLIGGSIGDGGAAIAVDEEGNAFVAGTTYSSDFPTTTSAFQQKQQGSGDAFVLKLHPEGTDLIYSTRLGGTGNDEATGIVLFSDGAVIVTGTTGSDDFPATAGSCCQHRTGGTDLFAAKISPSGSDLLFATYIGGSGDDEAVGCARCPDGSIAIAGKTRSSDFPATDAAFQQKNSGTTNGFVARLNSTGSGITVATLLGGTGSDGIRGIAVDADGDVYVTGVACSPDFPTTDGAYQQTSVKESSAFVARLNAPLTTLLYATFLGDGTHSTGTDIAAAGNGMIWMTGKTMDATFPTTPDAQFKNKRGNSDAFVLLMLCENLADAGFTARLVNDTSPATIIFNATPTTPDTSWRWDFSDGTGATGQHTTHTFMHAGTYPVIVFAETRAGVTPCIRTFEIGLGGNQSQPVSLKELPLPTPESTLSVISGESIEVHGTAQQLWSSAVRIWMFGPNAATVTEQQLPFDRSYSYHVSQEKTRRFADARYFIVVQEPGADDRFGVTYNATSDEVATLYRNTVLFQLANARSMGIDNSAGTLIQAITDPASRDSCTIYQVVVEQPWIEIDPIGTAQKNTIRVSGITNLPEGESLGVDVMTTSIHPTYKDYDWSHGMAETNTTVAWVNATTRGFSCIVNASLLRPGEYRLEIFPHSERYDVETTQIFNLMPEPSPTLLPPNPVDREDLHLPELTVNQSMEPVLLTHGVMLVPADEQIKDYEIPYGAVMLFSVDGIVRVFDNEGTQIAAFYDSNELHTTQVPNDAKISTEEYVTTVSLGNERILTKIHEADSR
ncbi:SBBP repeat-containing protein [Methanogenium sp. MK-MG]|uniref:DUF7948 domain-containing protein n=1 Tax=Methanogenium sp. MK-MG TaxID=2599926 RepID=UPI0013EAF5EC|nr:SBBP repeat-containing protein [Methanogenium sp. MK-MG]KAF1074375.1 hypothetical protein MKMG_01963 [Methanogenium sp. MK-MG]